MAQVKDLLSHDKMFQEAKKMILDDMYIPSGWGTNKPAVYGEGYKTSSDRKRLSGISRKEKTIVKK